MTLNKENGELIHLLNELKKTMLLITKKIEPNGLGNRFQIPLIRLHRELEQFIKKVDEEGYVYQLK